MDTARRYQTGDDGTETTARPWLRLEPAGAAAPDRIFRLPIPGGQPETASTDRVPSPGPRELSEAIGLVHEAAQSIRAAEERARDNEARMEALLQRATGELKSAEARKHAAEARARAAETRADEAEIRSREIEDWLRQIFATIAEELPVRR